MFRVFSEDAAVGESMFMQHRRRRRRKCCEGRGLRPWRDARVLAANFPNPSTVTVSPSASASAMVEVRVPSAAAPSAFDSDERAATRAHSSDWVMGALRTRVRTRCSGMRRKLSSGFAERSRDERRQPDWKSVEDAVRFAQCTCEIAARRCATGWAWGQRSRVVAVSGGDASNSPGDRGAQAGHSTGRRRKRLGNMWHVNRAQ